MFKKCLDLKRVSVAAVGVLAILSVGAAPSNAEVSDTHPTKVFRPADVRSTVKSATGVAIVNAASYLPGICPGGIASIFGVGLSVITNAQGATTDPLPFQIADVTVFVNNIPAPLYVVAYSNGGDQINFQVPYATPVGLVANGQGAVVDVYSNGLLVSSTLVDSYTEDPGIFIYVQNNVSYAIAVHYPDYSLISPADPAFPGEVIILYTTGLGPLTVNLLDGYGAPSDPVAYTQDQSFTVPMTTSATTFQNCSVLFSGLAPGFVGLNQLNLQLPANLPAGDLPIQLLTTYSNSGIAYLSVN